MRKTFEIVEKAYKDIIFKGEYDVEEGNKPINMKDKMCTVPKKMYEHIVENAKGCCFVFSAGMIHLMHEEGVEANMICTAEGKGIRASVLYKDDDGKMYVANPVEDIEMFTECNIGEDLRPYYYLGDAVRIPVKEFEETYGDIQIMPGFYVDEDMTLFDAMADRKKLEIKE